MISRAPIACRPRSAGTSVLGLLACVVAALALGASPASAAECPNEQLRKESRTNPVTGQPYSTGLPDCRAYEMVSPLYKQGHHAESVAEIGIPVAPDGETVGFASEGDFSDPENFKLAGAKGENFYTSHRGESGWFTSSALVPSDTGIEPQKDGGGLGSDFSPDLRSVQVSCGTAEPGKFVTLPTGIKCALRKLGGSWMSTPLFATPSNASPGTEARYLGGSSDLSRVFVQPFAALKPEDPSVEENTPAGIYEIEGLGTGREPELRLVSVDNKGKGLSLVEEGHIGGPALGDARPHTKESVWRGYGTDYQAISDNGEKVFFTATPAGTAAQSLYARVTRVSEGMLESAHTVEVSAQSESGCTTTECKASQPASVGQQGAAIYQGASADGSKVFFTTSQQLLNEDTNKATDLYEYEFTPSGGKLILISGGLIQPEDEVEGVVRTSSDGSHVYFVTHGKLATKTPEENENTWRNEKGEVVHDKALPEGENLYGYDTVSKEVRFVASGPFTPLAGGEKESIDLSRRAQTTPDGRYLVFSGQAHLAGDPHTNGSAATRAVYRFDFQTGELTWVSRAAPSLRLEREKEGKDPNPNEGKDALIAPVPGRHDGAEVSINDWNRAISNEGSYIVFNTAERLQANDVNEARDVYEWHCKVATGAGDGECASPTEAAVGLISDGHDPLGVGDETAALGPVLIHPGVSGISASGSDIFFFTHTELVGQDTDVLGDLYDARIDGGFPAPAEPSCSGEACQGTPSALPSFGSPASMSFPAGGNLPPPPASVPQKPAPKTKPLTRAQLLAKALKACRGKPKKKRAACESQARKKYASKPKAKKRGRTGK
jgi:hypothetical protein